MEYLFGMKTDKFVLLAADTLMARGISAIRSDVVKSYPLTSKCNMLCIGEGGDADQFANYIQKNVHLYKMRNGYEMTPQAAAHFSRKTLADGLRSREGGYMVHCIIGGVDHLGTPFLSYIDYMGTQYKEPYVFHGYGGYFCYAILDHLHSNDMDEEDAVEALKKCLAVVKERLVINLPKFNVYVIDSNGTRQLETVGAMDL